MKELYQSNYWVRWETCKDPESRRRKARKIRSILEAAAPGLIGQGGQALDVGCSIGVIDEHLAMAWPHWEIVGVDIDAEALRLARTRCADLFLCLGDAMRLPFPDATFDLVLCAQVYEHVPDWRRLLWEIHRVLRPGGICFFSGPNRLFPIEPHYGLPFLTYLPRPLAHRVLRWSGKAPLYYERPVTWWTLAPRLGRSGVRDRGLHLPPVRGSATVPLERSRGRSLLALGADAPATLAPAVDPLDAEFQPGPS